MERLVGALGEGLTGAAHAAERLPFLRSGEDPSTRVPRSTAAHALPVLGTVAGAVLLLAPGAARRGARPPS